VYSAPVEIASALELTASGASSTADIGFLAENVSYWAYATSDGESTLEYPFTFGVQGSWDGENWFELPGTGGYIGGGSGDYSPLPWGQVLLPEISDIPVRYLQAFANIEGGTILISAYYALPSAA
jgi:hypothetical protein